MNQYLDSYVKEENKYIKKNCLWSMNPYLGSYAKEVNKGRKALLCHQSLWNIRWSNKCVQGSPQSNQPNSPCVMKLLD
jgi:hypothetical protein